VDGMTMSRSAHWYSHAVRELLKQRRGAPAWAPGHAAIQEPRRRGSYHRTCPCLLELERGKSCAFCQVGCIKAQVLQQVARDATKALQHVPKERTHTSFLSTKDVGHPGGVWVLARRCKGKDFLCLGGAGVLARRL
jgi:hypothetical protein